jgi:hypothetical protein
MISITNYFKLNNAIGAAEGIIALSPLQPNMACIVKVTKSSHRAKDRTYGFSFDFKAGALRVGELIHNDDGSVSRILHIISGPEAVSFIIKTKNEKFCFNETFDYDKVLNLAREMAARDGWSVELLSYDVEEKLVYRQAIKCT